MNILIIGAGCVGKATGKVLESRGHRVVFHDKNEQCLSLLINEGYNVIYDYNKLSSYAAHFDIVMLCVGTPSAEDGSINLSFVKSAALEYGKRVLRNIQAYQVIVVRSTVPPWATRNCILRIFEAVSGKKVGRHFGLCMQPEFLRANSAEDDFRNQWITIIGEYDQRSGEHLHQLYEDFCSRIRHTSLETAEFMKYIHNVFNALKISFANEMWMVGGQLGINTNEAMELAVQSAEGFWNPKYGTIGGRPYGGACLPKDTLGIKYYARETLGIKLPLTEAIIKVNNMMIELAKTGNAEEAIIEGLSRMD